MESQDVGIVIIILMNCQKISNLILLQTTIVQCYNPLHINHWTLVNGYKYPKDKSRLFIYPNINYFHFYLVLFLCRNSLSLLQVAHYRLLSQRLLYLMSASITVLNQSGLDQFKLEFLSCVLSLLDTVVRGLFKGV